MIAPREALSPPRLPRLPVDSIELEAETGLTHVGLPDPALLALARGELAKQAEAKQVAETATELLELEARPEAKKPASGRFVWFLLGLGVGGVIAWAASSDVTVDVYRARLWTASTLRSIRGHAGDEAPVPTATVAPSIPTAIPTIDVTQLPKAPDEQAQSQAQGASVAPPSAPPAPPGAPALRQAPGPR